MADTPVYVKRLMTALNCESWNSGIVEFWIGGMIVLLIAAFHAASFSAKPSAEARAGRVPSMPW